MHANSASWPLTMPVGITSVVAMRDGKFVMMWSIDVFVVLVPLVGLVTICSSPNMSSILV